MDVFALSGKENQDRGFWRGVSFFANGWLLGFSYSTEQKESLKLRSGTLGPGQGTAARDKVTMR